MQKKLFHFDFSSSFSPFSEKNAPPSGTTSAVRKTLSMMRF